MWRWNLNQNLWRYESELVVASVTDVFKLNNLLGRLINEHGSEVFFDLIDEEELGFRCKQQDQALIKQRSWTLCAILHKWLSPRVACQVEDPKSYAIIIGF